MVGVKTISTFKAAMILVLGLAVLRHTMSAYALSSATFELDGSYSVSATGNRLVGCTLNTPNLSVTRPNPKNTTRTVTARVACVNYLPADTTLDVSAINGQLTPTRTAPPTISVSGASIPGKSPSQEVTISFTVNKDSSPGTYTYTFDISGSTTPKAMDYDRAGFTVSLTVN